MGLLRGAIVSPPLVITWGGVGQPMALEHGRKSLGAMPLFAAAVWLAPLLSRAERHFEFRHSSVGSPRFNW